MPSPKAAPDATPKAPAPSPAPSPGPAGPATSGAGGAASFGGQAGDSVPEALRGSVVDRRSGLDRRAMKAAAGANGAGGRDDSEGESTTGLERRRGPGRRRTDFTKAAEEGEMTQEQFLFVMAIDAFKRANGKMFPTWTDVLEVIRLLGYRKTMPSELNLNNAEDWNEPANAPTKVRSKPGHPEGQPRRVA